MDSVWVPRRARCGAGGAGRGAGMVEPRWVAAAFLRQIERKPIMPIILWLLGVPLVVVLLLMLTGFV
jgi:hypothetical protein